MDNILRGQLNDYPVRFFCANTSASVEALRQIHNCTATASAAVGRLLTAAMIMGVMMKGENDKLSLIIKGDGPIGKIVVTSDSCGRAKCDIENPDIDVLVNDAGKLDVAKAVGSGKLTIIKDIGLKTPYNSTTELISSEIAEDIAYYYAVSEQIPTVCSLGVLVEKDSSIACAGGYLIQVMPNCDEEVIDYLENRINEMPKITEMLNHNMSGTDIIDKIFSEGNYKYTIEQNIEPKYYCDCNYDKAEVIIKSLGVKELGDIIEKNEDLELKCHFCNKTYNFSIDRIKAFLN
ncbi:MAG: Hsp33 family molecular chaperone HslO [Eubacteriaceae bacterium]|nr:Hsp33 family molecular chaperone HslO [Eubacteriaceae bacterium]